MHQLCNKAEVGSLIEVRKADILLNLSLPRLSLVPAPHYRRYRCLHLPTLGLIHNSLRLCGLLRLYLLRPRFSHPALRQDDVLVTWKPRLARLAVRSGHILGSRAALSKYIGSEVRHCALDMMFPCGCWVCGEYHDSWLFNYFSPSQLSVQITTDKRANRTLLTSSASLENAKKLVTAYKTGKIPDMTPELWNAKKIIDSTIHPGTTTSAMAR